MGTDCRAFIEHRYGDDMLWELFCALDLPRNYDLFDALGGARCGHAASDGPCPLMVVPPRGLPSDLSQSITGHYHSSCCSWYVFRPNTGDVNAWEAGYKHGWLTTAEAEQVCARLGDGCPIEMVAAAGAMLVLLQKSEDVRLVFWFQD
jgi:hypothetical protein